MRMGTEGDTPVSQSLELAFDTSTSFQPQDELSVGEESTTPEDFVPRYQCTVCNRHPPVQSHTCGFIMLVSLILLLFLDKEYTVCHHVSVTCAIADVTGARSSRGLATTHDGEDSGGTAAAVSRAKSTVRRVGKCVDNSDAVREPDVVCGAGTTLRTRATDIDGRTPAACCAAEMCSSVAEIYVAGARDIVDLGKALKPGESRSLTCQQWAEGLWGRSLLGPLDWEGNITVSCKMELRVTGQERVKTVVTHRCRQIRPCTRAETRRTCVRVAFCYHVGSINSPGACACPSDLIGDGKRTQIGGGGCRSHASRSEDANNAPLMSGEHEAILWLWFGWCGCGGCMFVRCIRLDKRYIGEMRARGDIVRRNGRDHVNVNRMRNASDPCWGGETDSRARFASSGLALLGGSGSGQEQERSRSGQEQLLDRAVMPRDFMASAGRGPPVGFGNFM